MSDSIFSWVLNLISLISPVLIFVACCLYLSKRVKPDSILMFTGAGINVLLSLFYLVLMPMFMNGSGMNVSFYYEIARVIGFISEICFAIGFFLLIYQTVNKLSANAFINKND